MKEISLCLDQPKIKMQKYKQETFSYNITCIAFPIFSVSTECSSAGFGNFDNSNMLSFINLLYKLLSKILFCAKLYKQCE